MRTVEPLFIVILNYNNWPDSIECLESLFKSTDRDFYIILVDNHSTDNSLHYIKRWANGDLDVWVPFRIRLRERSFPPISKPIAFQEKFYQADSGSLFPDHFAKRLEPGEILFIHVDQNLGFGGGINVAIKYLQYAGESGFVWFLNPDTVVAHTTISTLKEKLSGRQKERVIWGCVSFYYDEPDRILFYGGAQIKKWSHGMRQLKRRDEVNLLDYIAGSFILMHTNAIGELGLFPENYFLYWEEADYCTKARRMGYQLKVIERAAVYDKISRSVGKGFLRDYYYTLSGLKFNRKYFPFRFPIIWASVFLKVIKKCLCGDFSGAWALIRALAAFHGFFPKGLVQ